MLAAGADPGIWLRGWQIWRARSTSLYGGLGAKPPMESRGKAPETDAILAFWDCICELIFTFDS